MAANVQKAKPSGKSASGVPSVIALVVDGQTKNEFDTGDTRRICAADLKRRFPAPQVKVFDGQSRRMEAIL
jgi:hypothetical protein